MAIVQRDVHINASPLETEAVMNDAARWPEWYPGMTRIDISPPFPEKGGKVVFGVKSAGLTMEITETVLDNHPGALLLMQMDGMFSGQARWELAAEGEGTHLTTTFDYTMPGGPLGKIMDALVVKRMNGKSLGEALVNLKARVEKP